jgi:hypothetical protein
LKSEHTNCLAVVSDKNNVIVELLQYTADCCILILKIQERFPVVQTRGCFQKTMRNFGRLEEKINKNWMRINKKECVKCMWWRDCVIVWLWDSVIDRCAKERVLQWTNWWCRKDAGCNGLHPTKTSKNRIYSLEVRHTFHSRFYPFHYIRTIEKKVKERKREIVYERKRKKRRPTEQQDPKRDLNRQLEADIENHKFRTPKLVQHKVH